MFDFIIRQMIIKGLKYLYYFTTSANEIISYMNSAMEVNVRNYEKEVLLIIQ